MPRLSPIFFLFFIYIEEEEEIYIIIKG